MNRPDNRLRLTLATDDYDHIRDLATGIVRAEGIDIVHLSLSVEEIFYRFSAYAEWDVSEYSFANIRRRIAHSAPPLHSSWSASSSRTSSGTWIRAIFTIRPRAGRRPAAQR